MSKSIIILVLLFLSFTSKALSTDDIYIKESEYTPTTYEKSQILYNMYSRSIQMFRECENLYRSSTEYYELDSYYDFIIYKDSFFKVQKSIDSLHKEFNNKLNSWTNNVLISENLFLKEYPSILVNNENKLKNSADSLDIMMRSIIIPDGGFPDREQGDVDMPQGSIVDSRGPPAGMGFYEMQSDMINALSSFIAGRFKEESLNLALVNIFRSMLEKDSLLISGLFPNTFGYLQTLLNDGTIYGADLAQLRRIINMDVSELDHAFDRNKEVIFQPLKDHPEQYEVFRLSNRILELNGTYSNYDLLTKAGSSDWGIGYQFENWLNFSKLLSSIVEEGKIVLDPNFYSGSNNRGILFNDRSTGRWISHRVNSSYIKKDDVRFFYGLYYDTMASFENWRKYLNKFYTVESLSDEMYKLIAPFQNNKRNYHFGVDNPLAIKETSVSAGESIDFFIYLCSHPVIQDSFNVHPQMFDLAYHTIELTEAFRTKRYSEAVDILALRFIDYVGGHLKNLHSISFLLEFGEVENAEDLRNLIESYALPLGSSSIKRNSKFDLSLNAYAGFTGGYEVAYGKYGNQTKANVGLTAPIGISTTFWDGHLTIFTSLLDLGSIVNQRINNDTISYSGLKFEQFFTPGLGLFYNFKSSPLTIGATYNYIPNLRTITYKDGNATITETYTSVSRINLSVLIDIPLFNIYNLK